MTAARGDRRPCVVGSCSGEMQYGRRSDQERRAEHEAGTARDDPRGWICSQSADHFSVESAAAVGWSNSNATFVAPYPSRND